MNVKNQFESVDKYRDGLMMSGNPDGLIVSGSRDDLMLGGDCNGFLLNSIRDWLMLGVALLS